MEWGDEVPTKEDAWLIEFGQRIKEARLARGFTQVELAERLDISQNHLSRLELGKTKCGILVFLHLVEALQISSDELLRPNIPSDAVISSNELNSVLEDCTQYEAGAIIKMARELKATLRAPRDNNN